ncbi:MAG TPA: YceI family protein [Gammaproteobacteria bacterium]|nr:YceI family protein [Gammaproteobacteria bacterium]
MLRRHLWAILCVLCAAPAAADETREFTIDAAGSDVHWLVYKAGSLARLGHNHVISVGDLAGTVTANQSNPPASRFELQFNVQALNVDDPKLRNGLGPDFASVPSENDIAGTRKNMLSDRVLMGDKYHTIKVTGVGPAGAADAQTMQITVELLGRSVPLTAPTKVEMHGDELTASGEFELTHTALGMMPFTVMLGALQVADNMKFIYRIHATAAAAPR